MSEMFSRPSKESHEGTIHYEAQMLRLTAERIGTHEKATAPQETIVYLECFLLHYRNLAQFLSGKGGSSGDLKITNYKKWTKNQLTKEQVTKVTDLAAAAYRDHCGDISTYLSHCTKERYEQEQGWDCPKMLSSIEPAIKAFENLFPPPQIQQDSVKFKKQL
jgi:hypothetical protein